MHGRRACVVVVGGCMAGWYVESLHDKGGAIYGKEGHASRRDGH